MSTESYKVASMPTTFEPLKVSEQPTYLPTFLQSLGVELKLHEGQVLVV